PPRLRRAPLRFALCPRRGNDSCLGTALRRSRRKRDGKRGEESLVLGGKPDSHPQPLRQSVVANGADDHALTQQGFVDTRTVADVDQQKVAVRGQRSHAELE